MANILDMHHLYVVEDNEDVIQNLLCSYLIYNNKKERMSIKALSKKYDVRYNVIKYLVRVIDKHGYEVLRTNKNNYYSPNQKEQIINRVLIDGESIFSFAVDEGLSSDGFYGIGFQNIKKTVII